jgi:ribosomal protein L11 methyltransferase
LHQTIIASDIDPIAVKTTADNAHLNAVSNWIKTIEAAGLQSAEIVANGPYDLIVANILAGPLAELASPISALAKTSANIILSGILTTQAAKVISAYARHNIVLNRRIILNEWTTLVLEKT